MRRERHGHGAVVRRRHLAAGEAPIVPGRVVRRAGAPGAVGRHEHVLHGEGPVYEPKDEQNTNRK